MKDKNNLLDEYIAKLYIEFCNSRGINHQKESIKKHFSEFKSWVKDMYEIKKEYANFLLNMNSNPGLVVELEKGKFNSIVPNLVESGVEAVSVTPYVDTFENMDIERYKGEIIFGRGIKPIIKYDTSISDLALPNIIPNGNQRQIDTLITQIPICEKVINHMISSSRYVNHIMYGSFGQTNDINKQARINRLKEIEESISFLYCIDCEEEFIEQNGIYSYIIMTKQKKLKHNYVKRR